MALREGNPAPWGLTRHQSIADRAGRCMHDQNAEAACGIRTDDKVSSGPFFWAAIACDADGYCTAASPHGALVPYPCALFSFSCRRASRKRVNARVG